MDKFKETVLLIENDNFNINQLVSILVLLLSKLKINTLSGMARDKGKTRRGILISNKYKKINIGDQQMAIKGICEYSLPF